MLLHTWGTQLLWFAQQSQPQNTTSYEMKVLHAACGEWLCAESAPCG